MKIRTTVFVTSLNAFLILAGCGDSDNSPSSGEGDSGGEAGEGSGGSGQGGTKSGSGGSSDGGKNSGGKNSGGTNNGGKSSGGTSSGGSNAGGEGGTVEPEPSCDDGEHNGDETDVDCGGPCEPCEDGKGCELPSDCVSVVCEEEDGAGGGGGADNGGDEPAGPTVCQPSACSDGAKNGDETDVDCGGDCQPCDDGEACDAPGDCQSGICGVDGACAAPVCGDDVQNGVEACDSGALDSATCDADCTAATCGDGYANSVAGEECDTGGDSATCDADCTEPSCGDEHVNEAAGEECDTGGDSPTCNFDCTPASCGDGYANAAAGELCDTAGDSATCNADCSLPSCGDAYANAEAGEECDDGGESASCDSDCTAAICGDGHVNAAAGEACDGQSGCNNATCQWNPVTINIPLSQLVGFNTTNVCGDNSDRRTQTNTTWGFNWTDPGIPFTPSSITVQFGGGRSCNPASRGTTLNGTSTGNYTSWNACNCAGGTSARTYQLTSASSYVVGGTNQFRVAGGADLILDTGTSGWPGGTYARVILNP